MTAKSILSQGTPVVEVYKALAGGAFPKAFKPSGETDFDQALRQAREMITETAWEWDHMVWATANSPADLFRLEAVSITNLARARLQQLMYGR